MPATSMRSVATPASFFIGTARDDDDDGGLTIPLAPETAAASSFSDGDFRSALLIYSEDSSRRTGVGCFARAMMVLCSFCGRCRGIVICGCVMIHSNGPQQEEGRREGGEKGRGKRGDK